MKRSIIIAGTALMILACSKEGEDNFTSHQSLKSEFTPTYSLNEHDSVGYYHNEILSQVVDLDFDDYSYDQMTDSIKAISNSVFDEELSAFPLTYETHFNPVFGKDTLSGNYKINYENLFSGELSDQSRDIATNILQLVSSADPEQYDNLKSNIINIEDSIISNSFNPSLSPEDRASLLKTTSVARHSAYFWMVENPDLLPTVESSPGGIIAAADAAGALVGFFSKDCEDTRWKCAAYGAAMFSGLGGLVILIDEG